MGYIVRNHLDAYREWMLQLKQGVRFPVLDIGRCGTKPGYNAGCRCEQCRMAYNKYRRDLLDAHRRLGTLAAKPHGSNTTYRSGCRCKPCAKASQEHQKKLRIAKILTSRAHGDRLVYLAGCRCDVCSNAESEYQRDHKKERAFNRRMPWPKWYFKGGVRTNGVRSSKKE